MDNSFQQYLYGLEKARGLPSGYLPTVMQLESSGGKNNVNTSNPGVVGPFQFDRKTADSVHLLDRMNPYDSARAAADLAVNNRSFMAKRLGLDPNTISGDKLYMAHQQGAGGATALLKAGNAPAGSATAPQNIAGNNGDPNAPASAFTGKWANDYAKAQAGIMGQGAPSPVSPISPNGATGGPVDPQQAAAFNAQNPPPPVPNAMAAPVPPAAQQAPPPAPTLADILAKGEAGGASGFIQGVKDFSNSSNGQAFGSSLGIMAQGAGSGSTTTTGSAAPAMPPAADIHTPDMSLMALLQKRKMGTMS